MNIKCVSNSSKYRIYNREPRLPMTKFGSDGFLAEVAESDPIIITLLIVLIICFIIVLTFLFFRKQAFIILMIGVVAASSYLVMLNLNNSVSDRTNGVVSQIGTVDRLLKQNMK